MAVAKDLGLDMDRLAKDMESADVKAGLDETMQLADALQINGTPTFVLGQDLVVGAVGYDQLKSKVEFGAQMWPRRLLVDATVMLTGSDRRACPCVFLNDRRGFEVTAIQAIVMAVLQGVTELFPISSLGHAVILPRLLNWNVDLRAPDWLAYLTVMHLGTAVALFTYFWRDWINFAALARWPAAGRVRRRTGGFSGSSCWRRSRRS